MDQIAGKRLSSSSSLSSKEVGRVAIAHPGVYSSRFILGLETLGPEKGD